MKRFSILAALTIIGTFGLELESESISSPVEKFPWLGYARITGAYLISPMRLDFIDNICNQLNVNVKITADFISALVSSELLEKSAKDLGFIRRTSFLLHKIETTYVEILNYLENSLLCSNQTLINLSKDFHELKSTLDPIWVNLTKLDAGKPAQILTQGYISQRPSAIRPSPNQQIFLGTALVGAIGFIGGTLLGTLFAGGDNSDDINSLNKNIQSVNAKVKITNERIDVLSKNLTLSIKNIKFILNSMTEANKRTQSTYTVQWNLDQLEQAASNLLILFKVSDNQVTLLRAGYLNVDLLNLETFDTVIKEGMKSFRNTEFPIQVTRENIPEILSLLKIEHLSQNRFIVIIPLVETTKYKAYSLVPHPIKLSSGSIMIAELENDVILVDETEYIVLSSKSVTSINENVHVIVDMFPIWSINHNSCAYAGYIGKVDDVLKLCNFKRLGNPTGIYVTSSQQSRMVYVSRSLQIRLECPNTLVKDTIKGLTFIPNECDLISNEVRWPAKLTQNIDLNKLVSSSEKGKSFDVTSLPPFILNETQPLHESIKNQIDKLPSEGDKFTFYFDKYDVSLEQVTSYSIVAYGGMTIIVIIHSVLLAVIFLPKVRDWIMSKRGSKVDQDESIELGELGMRKSIRNRFSKSPRDSLKLSFRKSLNKARRMSSRLSNRSNGSVASSLRSVVNSTRNSTRRVRQKTKNWLSPETKLDTPSLVNASTNTPNRHANLYPTVSISSVSSNNEPRYRNIPIPSFK